MNKVSFSEKMSKIKNLIKTANKLDEMGLYSEADTIDLEIIKLAQIPIPPESPQSPTGVERPSGSYPPALRVPGSGVENIGGMQFVPAGVPQPEQPPVYPRGRSGMGDVKLFDEAAQIADSQNRSIQYIDPRGTFVGGEYVVPAGLPRQTPMERWNALDAQRDAAREESRQAAMQYREDLINTPTDWTDVAGYKYSLYLNAPPGHEKYGIVFANGGPNRLNNFKIKPGDYNYVLALETALERATLTDGQKTKIEKMITSSPRAAPIPQPQPPTQSAMETIRSLDFGSSTLPTPSGQLIAPNQGLRAPVSRPK